MQSPKRKYIYIISLMTLLIGIGFFLFLPKDEKRNSIKEQEPQLDEYRVYICEASNISQRMIYIAREANELKKMEKILENSLMELNSLTNKIKINGLYRDRENKIYLDISGVPASMDVKTEYCLVKSIYLTIKNNFSWITDIKILISGIEKESLAGHILVNSLKESVEES